MRTQRGPRGQFSSLYGTTTLRLGPAFPYPPGGPRYERLVFDADGQLVVPLNEWYRLMEGVGAARTRETYLAVLRPWFGFLTKHGYQWNARPEAVREYRWNGTAVGDEDSTTAWDPPGPHCRSARASHVNPGAVIGLWPARRTIASKRICQRLD